MTKEEIENYKDFKKGDILILENKYCKVIETYNDILYRSTNYYTPINKGLEELNIFATDTKQKIYNLGYRLYVPEEKIEIPVIELTLEDIAKKFDVDVTKIKIKK